MIFFIYLPVLFIILANISGSSLSNYENSSLKTIEIFNKTIKNDIIIPSITTETSIYLNSTLSSYPSIHKLLSNSNNNSTTTSKLLPTKKSFTLISRELLKYRNKIDTKIIELTTTRENLRSSLDIRNLTIINTNNTNIITSVPKRKITNFVTSKSPISLGLSETSTINSTADDDIVLKKFPLSILSSSSSSSSSFISFKNNNANEKNNKIILANPTKTTITTTAVTTNFLDSISTTVETSIPTNGYFNITSQAGTHAYLPCNVKQFIKKPISWIRIRDGHILTVDQTTFIADQRFQSLFNDNPERWSLQIKFVQPKDSGWYECQVSTEPKSSSKIHLHIVEPQTRIIGESTRHVKAGSPVIIRCTISDGLEPPLFINWFYNDKQIYLHNKNHRWKTEIDREATIKGNDKNFTIASLIISSVTKKDSGNYTCRPSNSESATIVLHVLNGEYSASAITSSACGYTNAFQKYYYYNKNRILIHNIIIYKIILYLSYLILFKISSLNI